MEAGNCKDYTRLNVLYAYDYDKMGDSLQARSYIQKYFSSADTSDIQPSDYAFAGTVLAKFPESADSAGKYFQEAISRDTVKENQANYLNSAVDVATRTNNYGALLQLIGSIKRITGSNLSETQYYNIAKAIADAAGDSAIAFDSSKYIIGDSVIRTYISAYPDKPQPYAFLVRYAKSADRDTTKGLALPAIASQNQYEAKFKDTSASAKQIIFRNDVYLLIYQAQYAQGDKAANYQKAIDIANEMIALYPDASSEENKYAADIKSKLQSALDKFNKSKNSTNSSGGGKGKK
jgi:hypothetical protein